MVFTLGTVGQSASFQGKLKTKKEVSTESKRIFDLVSREIRAANQSLKISIGDNTSIFPGGLAILECENSCVFKYNQLPSMPNFDDPSDPGGNTMISSVDGTYKIYRFNNSSHEIFYREISTDNLKEKIISEQEINKIIKEGTVISSNRTETSINFSGFTPDDSVSAKQQPYIQFLIQAQTKNYAKLDSKNRAISTIRSMATSRKY